MFYKENIQYTITIFTCDYSMSSCVHIHIYRLAICFGCQILIALWNNNIMVVQAVLSDTDIVI